MSAPGGCGARRGLRPKRGRADEGERLSCGASGRDSTPGSAEEACLGDLRYPVARDARLTSRAGGASLDSASKELSMAEPAYPRTFPANEDGESWPAQGEWTYEDFLRLPDDGNRYEVIRGFLYVTPPPTPEHQFSSFELSFHLSSFVRENSLGLEGREVEGELEG